MTCGSETGIIIMNLNTFIIRKEELDVWGSYPFFPVGKVKGLRDYALAMKIDPRFALGSVSYPWKILWRK